MNRIGIAVVAVVSVASCTDNQTRATTQSVFIKRAQARSLYGANPKWLEFSNQRDLFRRVRDRAYGYCLSGTAIDMRCAAEQDKAVSSSIGAIEVADAQRGMANKGRLGRKEYYVATNPEIVPRILNKCWALYKEHGAADARILSVCLGNLTDYSPLVPLPVP